MRDLHLRPMASAGLHGTFFFLRTFLGTSCVPYSSESSRNGATLIHEQTTDTADARLCSSTDEGARYASEHATGSNCD